uniref:Uncharacterized protein n=1 Tax=viral metagenome TaxID=1070528 RepID=A0A6M3Y094_9ZZZZ
MKCPLIMIRVEAWSVGPPKTKADCLQAECAVWDKVQNQCPILSIADWLENIHSVLSGILDKIPHEEQFRK